MEFFFLLVIVENLHFIYYYCILNKIKLVLFVKQFQAYTFIYLEYKS